MRPLSKATKRRRVLEELENVLDSRNNDSIITSSNDDNDDVHEIGDLSNNSSDHIGPLNIQHASIINGMYLSIYIYMIIILYIITYRYIL